MLIYRTILAVCAITLGAAAVLAMPGFSPAVEASAPVAGQKSDRLDMRPLGQACSEQAWPYFEAKCVRDVSQRGGQGRTVRLITAAKTK